MKGSDSEVIDPGRGMPFDHASVLHLPGGCRYSQIPLAYKALQAEPKSGTMLPCNVIVQELADGTIDVAAVDPLASMESIRNPELQGAAEEIQLKLKKVIAQLQ